MAEADLVRLYRYIAAESGPAVAGGYLERLAQTCLSLEMFPERGTRRDHILPGLRTMGFERRATIAFRVLEGAREVHILRIFYGGQEYESALRVMESG